MASVPQPDLDFPAFIQDLASIVGAQYVLTAKDDVAPYYTDWRHVFAGQGIAVVRPGNTEEVAKVVARCAAEGVAIVPQAGNTGLVGGSIPTGTRKEVVISVGRMNRIRNIDALNDTMTVEAGCVLQTLQQAADDAGRLFPLSLAAEGSCQIGGNLSTNAGGVGVLRYGNARDLVLGLEVVLTDGRIWNGLKALRKDNTGYDLKHLFMGAEGTLGIITAAVLKLFPKPSASATAWIAVENPQKAVELLAALRGLMGDRLSSSSHAYASTRSSAANPRSPTRCGTGIPGTSSPSSLTAESRRNSLRASKRPSSSAPSAAS